MHRVKVHGSEESGLCKNSKITIFVTKATDLKTIGCPKNMGIQ